LKIESLAIGDEILTGKISDTNSTFVANTLFAAGFRLTRTTVILDDFTDLRNAVEEASRRSEVVVCFGGLGPTSDDKTAECIASLLSCDLVTHAESRDKMVEFYAKRKRPVTPQALKQVLYPKLATPLPNSNGMAPGFSFGLGTALFFFLPGVPSEMKRMFDDHVLPEIKRRGRERGKGAAGEIHHQTWRCLEIFESDLQKEMDPVEAILPHHAWLGYRTKFPENHLTLYFRISDAAQKLDCDHISRTIGSILKPWCYSDQNRDLEDLVLEGLEKKGWTIALAESCTGGLTTQRLTRVPGSSRFVWGGAIVYQSRAKHQLLNVTPASDEAAVSADCSRQLALNLKQVSGCAITAAITGWTGPGGGTETDPLGTLFLCGAGHDVEEVRLVQSVRTREENQWAASTHLLNLIRRLVQD
jgi:nicotinamide-nucleotide amidase